MLDQPDRLGRDRERADRFVVAGVADVEDREALAGPHLGLVVDLGDERAHRVHHETALRRGRRATTSGAEPWAESMSGAPARHFVDVVDEDHALLAEPLDDEPVVDDLVVAVHGRLERAHHPRERLDRHLDAGAEAPRLGERAPCRTGTAARGVRAGFEVRPRRLAPMPAARVVAVAPGSPAAAAGHRSPATRSSRVNGEELRDVIAYQLQADEPARRARAPARRARAAGRGRQGRRARRSASSSTSAVFDRVRTCDNHCPFCFIYQLPKGMRRSLYLKDDDYRLSFLYGNFTTLTRFTEADLERVVTERLGPLYVSIHATDPEVRTRLLRNRRGATSLRWLELLLDAGIEVHGQVVVCPGINDGAVLDDTLLGVLDRFPTLATVGVVPLGVSAHNHEPEMRPHTPRRSRGRARHDRRWQARFLRRARPPARVRLRRVLPPRRAAVPRRSTTYDGVLAARERHRHGAHVRGRGARRARRASTSQATGVRGRLLRLGRRRARRRLPRAAAPTPHISARRPRPPSRPIATDRDPHGRVLGAQVLAPLLALAELAGVDVRLLPVDEPVLRRQHRRHRPADRRRRRRRARRRARRRPLPPARRRAVARPLPRRHDARRLPRPVEVVADRRRVARARRCGRDAA